MAEMATFVQQLKQEHCSEHESKTDNETTPIPQTTSKSLEKKHRAKQAITSIRVPDTGLIHHDPFKILATWRSYYQCLFTAESEVESCEGELSEADCRAALHGMSRGKTPGSDGFPIEFFVSFWDLLGPDLKDDRLETKNYRPISLLNVDYKIATRAISGRLLGVIGSIVGYDQTCGIPGRTISENLMLMRDLIEYADWADISLALLSLDQEKAFDRVDWSFLQRILHTFGFGNSFRQMDLPFLFQC
ncbi:Hypothetical predicted protein [Paramuricea clavata]|uniref:Reverse transcriptase domain-containing protein n=1 Tax=Paramuricea clavata TaxID=317549 RepID=A0A6S7FJI4_PARCT|nr:Hypothetical predicted protein [Paramuricea clavata]